jgi:hypothetical protein
MTQRTRVWANPQVSGTFWTPSDGRIVISSQPVLAVNHMLAVNPVPWARSQMAS